MMEVVSIRTLKEHVIPSLLVAGGLVIAIGVVTVLRGFGDPTTVDLTDPDKMPEPAPGGEVNAVHPGNLELPSPRPEEGLSIEAGLHARRSVRSYRTQGLDLSQVGQILWAAQGVTDEDRGFRTAPSAGATFPLEVYLVAGEVRGLEPGVYRYIPRQHRLEMISEGDVRDQLHSVALGQSPVLEAPASLVITAVYARTTGRYGDRGIRYVHMEAGHASQNVYLQCESLELVTVAIGAFDDDGVKTLLDLPGEETPLYLMPVGRRQ